MSAQGAMEFRKFMQARYVIVSGWWCPDDGEDSRRKLLGDDYIRSAEFHKVWYAAVDKYTNPEKILIVDSASPQPPPLNGDDPRVEYVRLSLNAGHSTNHQGKYCGYTRAILVGLEYALQCDADYLVYVEQDALVYGDGIVEHCINRMSHPYMFGHPRGTVQRLQQSFFIIKLDSARRFIQRLHSIAARDGEVSPEEKFHIAASKGPVALLCYLGQRREKKAYQRLDWKITPWLRNYDFLPMGYGRSRPVDFGEPFFYFQHGDREEVSKFLGLAGLAAP